MRLKVSFRRRKQPREGAAGMARHTHVKPNVNTKSPQMQAAGCWLPYEKTVTGYSTDHTCVGSLASQCCGGGKVV